MKRILTNTYLYVSCYAILLVAAPIIWLAHTFWDSQVRWAIDVWYLHRHIQDKIVIHARPE